MKYELTSTKKDIGGKALYQIKALETFNTKCGKIYKDTLGGYIESTDNLSQDGLCWICENSYVYDNARVYDNAYIEEESYIYENAQVYGDAYVYKSSVSGNAQIFDFGSVRIECYIGGDSKIYNRASVFRKSRVGGYAEVYGAAKIANDSTIMGLSKVFDNACVTNKSTINQNAIIRGYARVEDSRVYGSAIVEDSAKISHSTVYGNAVIAESMYVQGAFVTQDLTKNLELSIITQTGLVPINGKVIAYKEVNKDLSSNFDCAFKYEIGKVIEAEIYDGDYSPLVSCGTGLHFSNAKYWQGCIKNSVYLAAEIDLKDILAVQEGKIRCKKAKIIGMFDPSGRQ